MSIRRTVLTATAAFVVLGGALGTTLGAAAPRQSAASAKAATLPTTNRYVVKLVSKIASVSGNVMVSSNGKWAVTNADDFPEDVSYMSQLINVPQGKVVGTLDGTEDGAYPVGVDNAGIVFGRGAHNGFEAFTWNGHTLVWTALSPALTFGCEPNDPPTELGLQFNSVNGAGDVVGGAVWRCPNENIEYDQAIAYSPPGGIEFSGTYTSGGKTYHPDGTWTIDDAGIISGAGILPTDPENSQEAEWTDNEAAVPQSIAADVGQSLVYPARTTNALWHGGDFVGGSTSYYNGPESLYVGGTDSETITPIPGTTGADQDPPPFKVQALSTTNLVVGTRTGTTTTAPTSAAVWSVGSAVTPLTSLLATSTSDHLLTAMAIDTKDEIFGTATKSTAAGAQQYLYEAVIAHPKPSVSLKSPKSGKSYKKNAMVKASYSCKAGKGTTLKSCKGTKADHHAISTSKVGKHSFTVVATDADGETTTKTVHYKVKA
jgi:hypothetical protein